MIYLDNSATTAPYEEALETFMTVSRQYFGNPSSLHRLGSEAEQLLTRSRQVCADLLKVRPNEVTFTSGGTEGNNLAIKGIAFEHERRGKHIITTSVEHSATLEACMQLEKQGFEVTYLPVDRFGRVSVESVKKAIQSDTILVSCIHVNNELGSVQPIEEIAVLLKSYPKVFFHVDHVQGIGKVPLKLDGSIDLCTTSAHKFHGLKGTGILYVRGGVRLTPLLHGGAQETRRRAGTENTAGIAAMTKALRITIEKSEEGNKKLEELKTTLLDKLKKSEKIFINTPETKSAPHIINFSVPGIKPEVLINSLASYDIFVSTMSACSSKLEKTSRILLACNLGEDRAESSIRVSMSYDNTAEEIETFLSVLIQVLPKLQEVMR
jgi:cysteine desulfurase